MTYSQATKKTYLQAVVFPVFSLLIGSFCSGLSAQNEPITLQVYTEVRGANEYTINPDGSLTPESPATSLIHAILARSGIDYELSIYPWARISQALDSEPNLIAYPVTRTEEREDRWLWLGMIQPLKYNLYGLRENLNSLPTTLDEARDYRVATINGDVVDLYLEGLGFDNLINIVDLSRAPFMLVRGRFDLFPQGEHRLGEFSELNALAPDALVPVIPLEAISTALYFAMSKQTHADTITVLEQAYRAVITDGTFEEIMGISVEP